jgi:hypothetical protein
MADQRNPSRQRRSIASQLANGQEHCECTRK